MACFLKTTRDMACFLKTTCDMRTPLGGPTCRLPQACKANIPAGLCTQWSAQQCVGKCLSDVMVIYAPYLDSLDHFHAQCDWGTTPYYYTLINTNYILIKNIYKS